MICAFTGPRPQKLPYRFNEEDPLCDNLKQRLVTAITGLCEQGVTEFYTGMALGVDLWCAEIVAALREAYPDILLHAVLPHRNQIEKMELAYKIRYKAILKSAGSVTVLQERETKDCYLLRNRHLVDRCDILLAVCNRKDIHLRSGTGATVRYANKIGKKIIFIPPVL